MASDEATLKATGKTQKEWNLIIDAFGGADLTHKEIARKLWDLYGRDQGSQADGARGAGEKRSKSYQEYEERASKPATKRAAASAGSATSSAGRHDSALRTLSGWWCQSVTVEYEYARGRRIKGETKDAGFEIGVQKTIPKSVGDVWEFLISDKGLSFWLGDIKSDELRIDKGGVYETKDGTRGEIRSVYPEERLRLTWQPKDREKPTTLQIYLYCPRNTPNKTSLRFHHEKLSGPAERQAMKKHWRNVLAKLEKTI